MTEKPLDGLLERYAEAVAQDTRRRSDRVRTAAQAHAQMLRDQAAVVQRVEGAAPPKPEANRSQWTISLVASLAVVGLAGSLYVQIDRGTSEDRDAALGTAARMEALQRPDTPMVADTPSSALGSARDKPDARYCHEIFKVLQAHDIGHFFYIGGNDSSDTVRIVSEEARKANYPLRCIHIPKTIDNDLVGNDHTPGFPSAARFVAQAFAGANLDNAALPGVYVAVVMGRHAGF